MNDDPTTLIHAYLDGELTDAERHALGEWLRLASGNVDRFVAECRVHSELCDKQWDAGQGAGGEGLGTRDFGFGDLGIWGFGDLEISSALRRVPSEWSTTFHPPLSTLPSPLSTSFIGGPVFSYMVATVIVGMMLLGAWAYKITHYQHPQLVGRTSNSEKAMEFVGQITGMVDCRWSDPNTETINGASVPLGRRYALASGLMEITYDSGAKVILQGPCNFEVESTHGGYLALGKLTAKVEGSGVRGQGSEKTNLQIPKSPNPQIPSSFIPHPSSFVVKTPTALITDLGTEFGVAVGQDGNTTSYVFRGSVKVQAVGDASGAVMLGENESALVVRRGNDPRVVVARDKAGGLPRFVRKLPRQRRSYIDLADIVAGGDGFGRASQRGIDAVTGGVMLKPAIKYRVQGDHAYHRVDELPLVDGVFVPDGGRGPVQVDSAGHRTSVLADTDNSSWNYIWSGQIPGDENRPIPLPAISCWLGDVNYAGRGHSVLCIPPNKGITFDVEAIRRANADMRIVRFTAVAGNTEMRSDKPYAEHVSADLWVFVDGKLRFSKTDVNSIDGDFPIDLPLVDADRYLTLVATDAGNGTNFDWTIFGDPRLEMKPTNKVLDPRQDSATEAPSVNRKEGPPMQQ